MFDNALLYNEPGSMIYRVIKSLINSREKIIVFFLLNLGCIKSSEVIYWKKTRFY